MPLSIVAITWPINRAEGEKCQQIYRGFDFLRTTVECDVQIVQRLIPNPITAPDNLQATKAWRRVMRASDVVLGGMLNIRINLCVACAIMRYYNTAMQQSDINEVLDQLLSLPRESECVEFKTKDNKFSLDELGRYFSALSNEANLKSKTCGWLIYGVNNDHNVVGTDIKRNPGALDSLKHAVSQHTTGNLTFVEVHEVIRPGGRVVMFEVPPAPAGIPIAWYGHYYGRDHDSLVALNIDEIERIRGQSPADDWSGKVCEGATLEALDPKAMECARVLFKKKHHRLESEVGNWGDREFLNKARLAINGHPTNSAVVLLGQLEASTLLSPCIAQLTWILEDANGVRQDYEHFGPPLLLQVDNIYARLRNVTIRQLPDGTLFPREIKQYDSWVVREALHNCIAHQDYSLCHRINVVETPSEVVFENAGSFLPVDIKSLLESETSTSFYRNWSLANAMVELNMIDSVGSGIQTMYRKQQERSFPLPEYDLSDNKVTVKISGRILDENYTRLLLRREDLDLQTVILLDKVQKGLKLSKDEHRKLKTRGLVEGRYPRIYVSSQLAAAAKRKAAYIKFRAFDDQYYKDMILSFLEKNKSASRSEIDQLLENKLSEALDEKQKRNKVSNLLQSMSKKDGTIVNAGSKRTPRWTLAENINR